MRANVKHLEDFLVQSNDLIMVFYLFFFWSLVGGLEAAFTKLNYIKLN